jgi:hypothetical protein
MRGTTIKKSYFVFLCWLFHHSSVEPQEKLFFSTKQFTYTNVLSEHEQRLLYDADLHAEVRSLLENKP